MKIGFNRRSSLRDQLGQIKDPISLGDQASFYKIKCRACEGSYIGQMGRKLRVRYKEHLRKSGKTEF